jgi:rare lipoprotein A (peptidoglycan hydrolase)
MRHRLPAALAAATILLGAVPAVAGAAHHRPPKRAESHVSLHISHHSLMSGRDLVVIGRVDTNREGRFRMAWGLRQTGTYAVRAYGVHDRGVSGSRSAQRRFTVYRRAVASYYGPGLYGNGVACGGTLTPSTLGVASKTLPCGTRVRLRYHGHTVTVPVIDRGPYVAGRDYDLTEATRERLHFPGLGVVLSSR